MQALEFIELTVAGALFGMAFWPYPLGWLAWFSLVPLLRALRAKAIGPAFVRGWVFGTTAWAVGMYWFGSVVAKVLGWPVVTGYLLASAIYLYHGLMLALAAYISSALASAVARRRRCDPDVALVVVFVPALVFLDGTFPMLFPNYLASTQYFHLPFVQSVDLFGTAGLAWLIAGTNAASFLILRPGPSRRLSSRLAAAMLLVLICNEGYGRWRIAQVDKTVDDLFGHGKGFTVALIQGAMPEATRFTPVAFDENLAVYNRLTAQALAEKKVDFVVWPQNTYERSISFDDDDADFSRPKVGSDPLADVLKRDLNPRVPMVVSGTARKGGRAYYAAFLLDPQRGILGATLKRDLTPLTEFIPMGRFVPRLYAMSPRKFLWLSSGPHHLLRFPSGLLSGVYLCYEALLENSAREYTSAGAQVLVNLAGDQPLEGPEPEQHLRLAAMRAIENRRFILRSIAGGPSAFFDPVGRIEGRIPLRRRAYSFARIVPMSAIPFHARSGRLFYYLALLPLCSFGILAVKDALS